MNAPLATALTKIAPLPSSPAACAVRSESSTMLPAPSPGQKMPTDTAPAAAGHAVDLSVRCEGPEQAVLLVIRAGSEIHRIGLATIPAVADAEAPQPVDDDRLSAGIAQLVDELSGRSIVGVDMTVAEISDQQRAGEWSEAARGQ